MSGPLVIAITLMLVIPVSGFGTELILLESIPELGTEANTDRDADSKQREVKRDEDRRDLADSDQESKKNPKSDSKKPESKKPKKKQKKKKSQRKKAEAKKSNADKPGTKKPEVITPEPVPEVKLPPPPKAEVKKPETKSTEPLPLPRPSSPKSPDRSKEAVIDPEKADPDFRLQGEYMGRSSGEWLGSEWIGLQVVALGDGKFEGVMFRGGLPGAGWDGRTKERLSGERDNGLLRLTNHEFQIAVANQQAEVTRKSERVAKLDQWRRISPTQDSPPPFGSTVLFDGRNTDQFLDGKMTGDRLLSVGAATKMQVGDFRLHLEFRTPYMPFVRGQGRGNSGVYIQQRYEVQVLDSFGLEGADNECGGLYKQKRPALNMCFPPLSWQTYDIYFTASRWDANGNKLAPARITVLHNGVPIHMNYELTDKTGGGKAEGPELLPILLQNHNNPVTYRNIWIMSAGSVPAPRSVDSTYFCEPASAAELSEY